MSEKIIFVHAPCGLLREAIAFLSFHNLCKILFAVLCPVTMQSDLNVFSMPLLFLKAILL